MAPRCAGQIRDSETGEDFFNARYFTGALGRFNSADPANAGADLTDPQSWNGYGYVWNNPLNSIDPSGLCGGIDAGVASDPYHGGGRKLLAIAYQYGYDIAFPFAGQSKLSGIFKVLGQSLGFKNGATATAAAMVQDVSAQSGATTSLYAGWSGGAISMQLGGVNPQSPTAAQVYFSPGGAILPDPSQNRNALIFAGSGVMDSIVNGTSSGPGGVSVLYPSTPGCGHDAACMWTRNQTQIDNLVSNNGVQSCPDPMVFLPHGVKIPLSSLFGGRGGGGNTGTPNRAIAYQPNYGEFDWWGLWVNAPLLVPRVPVM